MRPPLLIEPVWNRNFEGVGCVCVDFRSFNRTSMESKLLMVSFSYKFRFTFNRTSMESKQASAYDDYAYDNYPFNRTSMESKLFWSVVGASPLMAFNRTSMESKPLRRENLRGKK